MSEDQLIRDISRNPAQNSAVAVELELDCKVFRQPGGLLSKNIASQLHLRFNIHECYICAIGSAAVTNIFTVAGYWATDV